MDMTHRLQGFVSAFGFCLLWFSSWVTAVESDGFAQDVLAHLSAHPAIVTVHDVAISSKDGGVLVMNLIAKTYRYLEEDESAASADKETGRKRGGRR